MTTLTDLLVAGSRALRSALATVQRGTLHPVSAPRGLLGGPVMSDDVTTLLAGRLPQPDQRSCGAASLVVSRMVHDPGYAEFLATGRHPRTGHVVDGTPADRFRLECLSQHRRTNGPTDVRGRLQLPWLLALGTAPWALAREMSGSAGVPGTTYRTVAFEPGDPGPVVDAVDAALRAGHTVPLYVGNALAPRHVVLALSATETGWRCYEPAAGRVVEAARGEVERGRLALAGWSTPWLAVLPGG